MKYIKSPIVLSLFLIISLANAQKAKVREAVDAYDEEFSYIKTTKILESIAEKGYTTRTVLEKLGNAYYFNNNMEKASKWYGELMASSASEVDSEYYWRYAQSLKGVENYEESDKWMRKFSLSNPKDLRSKAFNSKTDYLASIDKVSFADIEVVNLDLNSELSDYGSAQYKDEFIFASSRGGGKAYKWNGEPYLDLYSATKNTDGVYSDEKKLGDAINTRYHESSASFTPDDTYMFFTRNNYFQKHYKEDSEKTNRLNLYRATKNSNEKWDNIEKVHFNSDDYSVSHPSVNVYGTLLYFASDMPGSIGDSDIFVVEINEDGTLGDPENLGGKINTQGRESFPFINEKGDLYYASSGHPGLGGLDIYVVRDFESKYQKRDTNYILENVGKPINSKDDDFAYYENLGTKEGFFSSNREGGKGSDDIYSFTVLDCKQRVEGVIKDKETQEIIAGAALSLLNALGNEVISTVESDENGQFVFEDLGCDVTYVIRVAKETYIGDEKQFTTPANRQQDLVLELFLEKDEQEIKIGDDLAKTLGIPIIYFNFDKAAIRYDAEVELQKILEVMTQYPDMVIDIKSHTDCRGPKDYNESLSDRRAQSTREYLISKGISSDRLTAKGYGESELVNDCGCEPTNESSCSEAAHQLNRRSEFIIVKI